MAILLFCCCLAWLAGLKAVPIDRTMTIRRAHYYWPENPNQTPISEVDKPRLAFESPTKKVSHKTESRYRRSIGAAEVATNNENEPKDSAPLTQREIDDARNHQHSPADVQTMDSFICDTKADFDNYTVTDNETQSTSVGFGIPLLYGDKWKNKKVYYNIESGFTDEEREAIADAFQRFQDDTCLKFIQRDTERDYVNLVRSDGGCSSSVGRVGGKQDLFLADWCAEVSGIVQHELMHAIGFLHEHQRPDRDAYVAIMWANIPPPFYTQFYAEPSLPILSYDYGSIMHYGMYAGSWNGLPAIVPLNGATIGDDKKGLSKLDVKKVKKVYCEDNSFNDPLVMVQDQVPIVIDAFSNVVSSILGPFADLGNWIGRRLTCVANFGSKCV